MAMFLGEISFLLALALFASGLVLWHQGRQATVGLLRGAGAVLVVGTALTALCTWYFSVRYLVQGEFDHAYAPHPMAAAGMMEPGGGMGPGMMGPRETGPVEQGTQAVPMRPGVPPGEGARAPETEAPGHVEHHPDAEGKN